jgi:chromosome segregation ATPase
MARESQLNNQGESVIYEYKNRIEQLEVELEQSKIALAQVQESSDSLADISSRQISLIANENRDLKSSLESLAQRLSESEISHEENMRVALESSNGTSLLIEELNRNINDYKLKLSGLENDLQLVENRESDLLSRLEESTANIHELRKVNDEYSQKISEYESSRAQMKESLNKAHGKGSPPSATLRIRHE